jgi:hypothetical protein
MMKLLQSQASWLLFSLLISLCVNEPVAAQAAYPPRIHFELGNRVAVIAALPPGVFVPLPVAPVVFTTGGAPSAGLIHSGYSAPDPDGKVVLLNLTVAVGAFALSPSEKQSLLQKGYLSGEANYTGRDGKPILLDISLPSNPIEEARLRRVLKLPRIIQAGSSVPLQIRWEGRDGREIYGWLTQPDGLKIVVRLPLLVNGSIRVADFLPLDKRRMWWDANANTNSMLEFREGVAPLALDMLISCGCVSPAATLLQMTQYEGLQLTRTMAFLDKITKRSSSGQAYITRSDLLGPEWAGSDIPISANIEAAPELQSGAIFISHPELVKDLSGSTVGLEGLISGP